LFNARTLSTRPKAAIIKRKQEKNENEHFELKESLLYNPGIAD